MLTTQEHTLDQELDQEPVLGLASRYSHRILTAEEEQELAVKIRAGCEASRNFLVEHNLRLVASIGKSYHSTNVPMDDIIQSGSIGLIKAAEKYKPNKGRFSTYAVYWIKVEISYLFDNVDRPMDLPLQTARAIKEIDNAEIHLAQKLRRKPTETELIEEAKERKAVKHAKKPIEDLLTLRERQAIYLDNDNDEGYSEHKESLSNIIPDSTIEDPSEVVARRDLVEQLMKHLNEQQRLVLTLYYGLNDTPKTLKQIADQLGVGEQRVQQIHRDIIKRIRKKCQYNEELASFFIAE